MIKRVTDALLTDNRNIYDVLAETTLPTGEVYLTVFDGGGVYSIPEWWTEPAPSYTYRPDPPVVSRPPLVVVRAVEGDRKGQTGYLVAVSVEGVLVSFPGCRGHASLDLDVDDLLIDRPYFNLGRSKGDLWWVAATDVVNATH